METGTHPQRRIVLCLDGTWNSGFEEAKRRDQHTVLKPTNPLKLCRAVRPFSARDGVEQITYYDVGVGALALYPGLANYLLRVSDRMLGGAWGAGFEGNVEDALNFLTVNYEVGDEVFVFGFSRGAAEARAVTQFLDWSGGVPEKCDAYYLPLFFREFVRAHGEGNGRAYRDGINQRHDGEGRPHLKAFRPVTVTYLGVWDTVLALGSRFESRGAATSTTGRSFYAGKVPSKCVVHARHALAVDERRYDFRPEIWQGPGDTKSMEQRWFAGVHSNVGGAYGNDGLANIALKWIVSEAENAGVGLHLDVDHDFLKPYVATPADTLYNSYTPVYFMLDMMRVRLRRGGRSLVNVPPAANAHLDPTVIQRMCLDPSRLGRKGQKPRQTAYRPKNVIEYLATLPDSEIAKLGGPLPEDVQKEIEAIRQRAAPSHPVRES